MKPRVREAGQGDLDFLLKLEKSSFAANRQSNRQSLKNSILSASQHVYVLEKVNGKKPPVPVGSATLHCHKRSMRIQSIAISSDCRGEGMGEFLLHHIIGVAMLEGYEKISLEADANNHKLVDWYKKFKFEVVEFLEDYYGPGEPASRMVKKLQSVQEDGSISTGNVLVVDNSKKWNFDVPGVEVVSARKYLSDERFRNSEHYQVLNLCNSYKTHSLGYYVSLLAYARNHKVVPSVMTIKDISNINIAQSLCDEIKEFLQSKLKTVREKSFEIPVILGNTPRRGCSELARKLFALFKIPFFSIIFAKNDTWKIKKITSLNMSQAKKIYPDDFHDALVKHFERKRYYRTQLKTYIYDLAILVNNDEKTPPSCPVALNEFRKAAEKVGFFVEFITKMDYRRISEFDALFIRETTSMANHTYRFARHAYTEGLVVIDDPWSILLCSNKIYLYERFARSRIRQPKSWLLTKTAISSGMIKTLPYPLVLKLPESSFSLGVYMVNNLVELEEKLENMLLKSDLVIAQEFLKTGFDWRIGLLDNTPLFACKYFMADGHWQIYNWARDEKQDEFTGNSEAVPINQVPAHILKAAVKASSLIGDGLYGVDLKDVNGHSYVIEVNDNPSIDAGIEDALLQDELYLRVMTSIFNRIEKERSKSRYLLY